MSFQWKYFEVIRETVEHKYRSTKNVDSLVVSDIYRGNENRSPRVLLCCAGDFTIYTCAR